MFNIAGYDSVPADPASTWPGVAVDAGAAPQQAAAPLPAHSALNQVYDLRDLNQEPNVPAATVFQGIDDGPDESASHVFDSSSTDVFTNVGSDNESKDRIVFLR